MRATYLSFTPSDEDTDGIADGLTGVGPWDSGDFIRTDVPDGLAHQLSLTSSADLSGITITLTGTDADGKVITEAVTGPDNATVESSKYFKTLTGVSASATLGANTLDIGWVDEFASKTIPLDHYARRPASVQLTITGTAAMDIAGTLSDIRDGGAQDSWTWLNDGNFTNKSASLYDELSGTGIRAIRLEMNSYSSGATVTLAITQPR